MSLQKSQPQVAKFRRWIVKRLKETNWVHFQDDSIEDVSRRLGLRPELLLEAKHSFEEEARRRGLEPQRTGLAALSESRRAARCEVVLPVEVFRDWEAHVQARGWHGTLMLRSLVHKMLLSSKLPAVVTRTCIYRGKFVPLRTQRNNGKGHYSTVVECDLSDGAHQALWDRARKANVSVSALLRGAILDLLEGRTTKVVPIYTRMQMWNDPLRYARYEPEV